MMKRKNIVTLIVLGFTALGIFLLLPYVQLYLHKTAKTVNTEEVVFFLWPGTSMEELELQLVEQGVLKENSAFKAIAEYKELDDNNIGAGKYIIKKRMKISHLVNGFKLNALGNGNGEVEVSVTFNNCRDLEEVSGKVSRFIAADSLELITFLKDPVIISKYGFTKQNFPAMFIPNTYNMFWDTDAEQFVQRMADEFKQFWTPERNQKAQAMNLTQSKIVTLASIVYAEQSLAKDEWKTIAGLYLNRIRIGMKLQSDPTFKFCWGRELDKQQRLYNKHREIDCPYNTYIYAGLPPGPINIPPAGVVDAVLNHEKHDYLFMCAKANNSGKHNFAKTYIEHQKNAAAFQKWMNDNNIR
jgi:UPF0755 protein